MGLDPGSEGQAGLGQPRERDPVPPFWTHAPSHDFLQCGWAGDDPSNHHIVVLMGAGATGKDLIWGLREETAQV